MGEKPSQIKQLIKLFGTIFFLVLFALSFPVKTYAVFCNTVGAPGGIMYAEDFRCLEDIFKNILQIIFGGISITFFLMIISGGIKILTSGGDPKSIENGQGRITFSVFGLVLTIASWLILRFVSDFTGVTQLLYFQIPHP